MELARWRLRKSACERAASEPAAVARSPSAAIVRPFTQLLRPVPRWSGRTTRKCLTASSIQPSLVGDSGRGLAAGAALQKQEQRQIVVDAVGRANHAVEELDALGRAGDWCRHGAAAHGAADSQEHWLKAAPVEGDIDAVVLDIESGDVVRSDEGHVIFRSLRCFGLTNSTAAGEAMRKSATIVANF